MEGDGGWKVNKTQFMALSAQLLAAVTLGVSVLRMDRGSAVVSVVLYAIFALGGWISSPSEHVEPSRNLNLKFEPEAGTRLEDVAENLHRFAEKLGCECFCDFNGVPLQATPGMTLKQILEHRKWLETIYRKE